jgi:DNA-binding NarL/FixJ family response regulator
VKRVSLEFLEGQHYLVVRVPITIEAPKSFVIRETELDQFINLTKREKEVLDGVAHFKQNKEIASDLNLSERTIKFHVSSLLTKYRVSCRAQLASKALIEQAEDTLQ